MLIPNNNANFVRMKHGDIIVGLFLKLLFLGSSLSIHAQSTSQDSLSITQESSAPWQTLLQDITETEDFENTHWEDYEEDLEELASHPLNLNTATREDMERLPFLTAQQAEDILAYIHRYRGMKSMGELAMIKSLNWYQRQLLGYFVYTGQGKEKGFPSLGNIMRYAKHEVMGMVKIPLYERQGDVDGYMGYKYKHGIRYQMHYGDYVKLGFLGAQDAGEPFGKGKNKLGYDFYSFYLQVRKLGRWKNITLGRYRLHEGLGLILNNDFSFGKLSALSAISRSTSGSIRVHSSRSSANYLQGFATTYTLTKGLDLTTFFSYRKIDATLSDEGGIRTILKTGLHRTTKEIEKQNVASNTLVGGNINYRWQGWHVGATAFYTSFSRPLTPNKTLLYKRFAPQGDRFRNASIDYGYLSHRWNIAGETATGDCGSWATINTLSFQVSSSLSLLALQRFFSARYSSLFSNTFSEGSDAQDENGCYLGFTWTPAQRWSITAYSDFAYFAWPKYQTKESTQSWDNLVNILWQPAQSWTIGARMRYKDKAGTSTERCRLYASITKEHWNARTSLDYVASQSTTATNSHGYMLNENIGYQMHRLRLSGSLGYFHTSDYASRIYAYEPGLLYQMCFGSYYGEGIRYTLVGRTEIGKHLLVIAKLGTTDYFDRSHISSGLQTISRSSQSDVEVQLRWAW